MPPALLRLETALRTTTAVGASGAPRFRPRSRRRLEGAGDAGLGGSGVFFCPRDDDWSRRPRGPALPSPLLAGARWEPATRGRGAAGSCSGGSVLVGFSRSSVGAEVLGAAGLFFPLREFPPRFPPLAHFSPGEDDRGRRPKGPAAPSSLLCWRWRALARRVGGWAGSFQGMAELLVHARPAPFNSQLRCGGDGGGGLAAALDLFGAGL